MTPDARAIRYMMLSGDPALIDDAIARMRPVLSRLEGRVGSVASELCIPRTTFWRWTRSSPALQAAIAQARSQAVDSTAVA